MGKQMHIMLGRAFPFPSLSNNVASLLVVSLFRFENYEEHKPPPKHNFITSNGIRRDQSSCGIGVRLRDSSMY